MRKKLMRQLLIGMASTALLSGCKQVEVKDSTWFTSLGTQGAAVDHMLTNQSGQISLDDFAKDWDDLSNPDGPLTCTRLSTLIDIKTELEQLCSYNPNECTVDIQQSLKKVDAAVDHITKRRWR